MVGLVGSAWLSGRLWLNPQTLGPKPKDLQKQRPRVVFLHVLSWTQGLCAGFLFVCSSFLEKIIYIRSVFLILSHYFLFFKYSFKKLPGRLLAICRLVHYFVNARKTTCIYAPLFPYLLWSYLKQGRDQAAWAPGWLMGLLLGFFWLAGIGWLAGWFPANT